MLDATELRKFQIALTHHLAAEEQMFQEGLIEIPPTTPREPEQAQAKQVVTAVPDFPLKPRRRPASLVTGDFQLKYRRRA